MFSSASGFAKFSNMGFNFLKEPAEMEALFHSMALQQIYNPVLSCIFLQLKLVLHICHNLMG